jgi:CRISPR type IV-associated protein Csf3
MKTTVRFLRNVLITSKIEGSRGRLDIFADRLIKAASEPTLAGAMEHLLRSVNASADKLDSYLSVAMIRAAASPDAPRLLRWLRDQAKLVTMLAAAVCRFHIHGEAPTRDEAPMDVPLPLARWKIGGEWGWRASALFPEGQTAESLQYWRKRFCQGRVELTEGSPNLTNGPYRDWNMPLPLLLAPRMVAYAFGEMGRIRRELRRSVKYLGKKRAYGRGAVIAVEVEETLEDWSLEKDGMVMRWLPSPQGTRLIRPRPPYWNSVGRMMCAEIGSPKAEIGF